MKRQPLIIVAAATVVVLLAWFIFIYKPIGNDVSSANKRADTANAEATALDSQLRDLRGVNVAELKAQKAKIDAAVPADPDLAQFILDADDIATESGVNWVSINPSPPAAAAGGPTTIAMQIQIQAGFFQLLDYMRDLQQDPSATKPIGRLVIVDSVTVSVGGTNAGGTTGSAAAGSGTPFSADGSPVLTVSLTARMFTRAAPPAAAGTATTATAAPSTATTAPTATTTGNN
ncbi:MAG: Tfp pilus assembly protein PilO [Actinomycetia bacterium]|nr:Tfp pilus assembly protein PilO [Actinomycetes bacterium]